MKIAIIIGLYVLIGALQALKPIIRHRRYEKKNR